MTNKDYERWLETQRSPLWETLLVIFGLAFFTAAMVYSILGSI